MPRFSEAAISDLSESTLPPSPIIESASLHDGTPATERRSNQPDGEKVKADESSGGDEARRRASELLRSIGTEFSRLRKVNRSGAWGDLEDKIAKSGDILVLSGMISSKDWVGMLIDIEQFRKAEGGTAESPGDALAKWLSEPEKVKRVKKAKAN